MVHRETEKVIQGLPPTKYDKNAYPDNFFLIPQNEITWDLCQFRSWVHEAKTVHKVNTICKKNNKSASDGLGNSLIQSNLKDKKITSEKSSLP